MQSIRSRLITRPHRQLGTPGIAPTPRAGGWLIAARLASIATKTLVGVLALVGFLSVTRGTPVRHVHSMGRSGQLPAIGDSGFVRNVHLYTGAALSQGNTIEVLANGDGTYPRLTRDIMSAQRSVTVQMYYSRPGVVADTVSSLLKERARRGVRVLVLLDAFGSQNLTRDWVDSLRRGGVEVEWLRPMRWYALDRVTRRSHVRSVVVDGAIGYTGGFGLADYWLGDGRRDGQWRETNVRFEGPEVTRLQAAFMSAWAEATGELLTGTLFFPSPTFKPRGSAAAALLYTEPTTGSTAAERFLALTILSSRKRLYITNSYFLPDDDFRRFLREAAARGVDVRVLTASTKTDIKSVYYAARARYETLLASGVRIYEYQPTMVHSKTIVADGIWSVIGSMNFDNRSLAFNDEANLLTTDPAIAAVMDSHFIDDLERSKEITLAAFRRRPWWEKVLEFGAALVSRVL